MMRKNLLKITSVCLYLLLIVFQVSTTNIPEAYKFSAHEIDLQIKRMNMYPPHLARFGYILEAKKEVQIGERVIKNFFEVVDIRNYFPRPLPYVLAPLLFFGVYLAIKKHKKNKLFLTGFLTSLVLLTLIGTHAKYGLVLLYPFFVFFFCLGLSKIVRLIKL